MAVLLAFVAPLITRVSQLAISRERECLTYVTDVGLTNNPHGIIGALQKISQDDVVL